jgi:hypothetical protein
LYNVIHNTDYDARNAADMAALADGNFDATAASLSLQSMALAAVGGVRSFSAADLAVGYTASAAALLNSVGGASALVTFIYALICVAP